MLIGPTIAPQNVTVRRYSGVMFVSWNELSAAQSRGFPVYIVQYQPTNTGSLLKTNAITENYVIIDNLQPNINYLVSVAAAVREGGEVLMGPNSENIEVAPTSSKFCLTPTYYIHTPSCITTHGIWYADDFAWLLCLHTHKSFCFGLFRCDIINIVWHCASLPV